MTKEKSLIRKIGLSAAMLSAASFLTLVSCGLKNTTETGQQQQKSPVSTEGIAKEEAETTAVAPSMKHMGQTESEATDATSVTETLTSKQTLEKKLEDALKLRDETKASLDDATGRLAAKRKYYSELQAELSSLRESGDVDSTKAFVSVTNLDSELQLLNRDLTVSQQNVMDGFKDLHWEIVATTKALAGADKEFANLREFGTANVGREIMLYFFGLKILWGLFTGYRVTSFTYKPELSKDLRKKLEEISASLSFIVASLSSGLVMSSSKKTMETIDKLHWAVDDALKFLKDNKQALKSRAVSLPKTLFPKLKTLLDLASSLPEQQAKMEEVRAKLDSFEIAKRDRTEHRKKLEAEITKTHGEIQILIEEVRVDDAKLTQVTREVELLEAEVKG